MNTLGKIFIGLVFAMSLLLMSYSVIIYKTHENWKKRADELAVQLKTRTDEKSKLEEEKNKIYTQYQDELGRRIAAITALQTEVEKLNDENKTLVAEKTRLDNDLKAAVDTLGRAHDSLANARAEMHQLRADMRKVQADWGTLFTKLVKETDRAQQLSLQLATYQSVGEQLAKDYRDACEVLRKFDLKRTPDAYNDVPLKGVEGLVTEVRPNGWVEISIGGNSGLMKGHKLDIYRSANGHSSYIGKVEVVRTEPDKAACIILPEYRKGTVQREDTVAHIEIN